ncbi:MAG: helix-turn-helix domain-containing protein [Oscillospiraceae bacterium]|jgi:transcriptional regulator with XRE-family HTH domain|nr:helix-turn-helix domain-containing protein [Oscillospiraceae bacterium]
MKIYDYNGTANICGRKIREVRERKNFSQEQFAAKLQVEGVNLTQKAISRIETGKRVVADYELLAASRVLGVTLDWLLSGIISV